MVESAEPRGVFLRRRVRRLGFVTVAGQLIFVLWSRFAASRAANRVGQILTAAGLDDTPLPEARVIRVGNANAAATRRAIARLDPDVVVVNGTRILTPMLLESIDAPILNLHAGITPYYRGVHGGYWALAMAEPERCGVTVHLVDAGVDTGEIVAQATISPGPDDSFFTYPALQYAAGIPLMLEAVRSARAGDLKATTPLGAGRQYFHPTLWGYVATGLRSGVW